MRATAIAASVLTVLLAVGIAVSPASPASAATVPSDIDSQIETALSEVNKIRKSQGKPALTLMCALNDVAQAWSAKQANANKMSHNPDFGEQMPSGWSKAGETVAKGYSSLAGAVKGWKDSSGHYKIMIGDYTHVGFGIAISSGGTRYATANFGKYSSGAATMCPPTNDGSLPGRIAGPDRYTTASYIADVWSWERDAKVVFLATGENYPDALAAAAAAAKVGAPVLLTPKKKLPNEVRDAIRALAPDQVIILGSTSAVSTDVFKAVQKIVGTSKVSRIGGSDRYDTMRKIVRYAWDDPKSNGLVQAPTVIISTGRNFPDALSAGPAAAVNDGAVILVDGKAKSVPSATLSLIKDLAPKEIVIAGGTGTVSSAIQKQLAKLYPGKVVRVAGNDRYDTSRRLVDRYFSSSSSVFFATGTKFPDALAGAALAGALPAPLLVTPKNCMPKAMKTLVQSLGAKDRVLLGAGDSLSGNIASLKTC